MQEWRKSQEGQQFETNGGIQKTAEDEQIQV
jgi:hypothetical protein